MRYTKALPISNLAKCPDDATHALVSFDEYRVDFCRAKTYTYKSYIYPDTRH